MSKINSQDQMYRMKELISMVSSGLVNTKSTPNNYKKIQSPKEKEKIKPQIRKVLAIA